MKDNFFTSRLVYFGCFETSKNINIETPISFIPNTYTKWILKKKVLLRVIKSDLQKNKSLGKNCKTYKYHGKH